MTERRHPAERLPPDATLAEARKKAEGCRACDLWRRATQTVFGAGADTRRWCSSVSSPAIRKISPASPSSARRPCAREPRWRTRHRSRAVYVTNAVKHFKWVPRGKRRPARQAAVSEIQACQPWLMVEFSRVRPRVVVCLGTTAARAVMGRSITCRNPWAGTADRAAPAVFVTAHPSAILRAPDSDSRARGRDQLVADLKLAAARAR
jgi:DNA polymerase